jgi:hypothetical protein
MRRLYCDEYADFTVKHFHERLRRRHNYLLGYTVTRLALQSAGLVTPTRRRGKHRRKRQRRPIPGMLLFQDGSHRHHYVKATVRVHEYPDGQLAVFDGPRCLARYDRNGTLLDDPMSRAA